MHYIRLATITAFIGLIVIEVGYYVGYLIQLITGKL